MTKLLLHMYLPDQNIPDMCSILLYLQRVRAIVCGCVCVYVSVKIKAHPETCAVSRTFNAFSASAVWEKLIVARVIQENTA